MLIADNREMSASRLCIIVPISFAAGPRGHTAARIARAVAGATVRVDTAIKNLAAQPTCRPAYEACSPGAGREFARRYGGIIKVRRIDRRQR